MSRSNLDTTTATALVDKSIFAVWIFRFDVVGDPVYVHSGLGDLTFGSGLGYDANLVGFTFKGIGNIFEIGAVTDDTNGSQVMNVSLPGIDTNLDYLHQIITNGDLWQRRGAWVWIATYDATGAMLGKPFRVKSGRMDQMPIEIDPDKGTGTLTVSIESQQAYNSGSLYTRYIDQGQIDASDVSQQYVASLANKVPEIGNTSSNASGGTNPHEGLFQRTIDMLISGIRS